MRSSGELVIKATQSKSRDYVKKPNLKVGESVAGRAVQEGRVLTVLDVKQAPGYRFPDIAEREGLCSMVCVPLRIKARVDRRPELLHRAGRTSSRRRRSISCRRWPTTRPSPSRTPS